MIYLENKRVEYVKNSSLFINYFRQQRNNNNKAWKLRPIVYVREITSDYMIVYNSRVKLISVDLTAYSAYSNVNSEGTQMIYIYIVHEYNWKYIFLKKPDSF